jgi:hypothetical protein
MLDLIAILVHSSSALTLLNDRRGFLTICASLLGRHILERNVLHSPFPRPKCVYEEGYRYP